LFYIYAMIALIFISPALCCAPSCACLYFVLLPTAFIMRVCVSRLRVGFLVAFVPLLIWLLRFEVPPSRGLSFVHRCACRPHVDFQFAFGNLIVIYSLSFGLRTINPYFILLILSNPLVIWIFIPSGTLSFMFLNFCLAPCFLGASFLLEHFMLL
jgi:hypothetical protein